MTYNPTNSRVVVKYKDIREELPQFLKYPSYKVMDAFPVLGAVDFQNRNKKMKNQFKVEDSKRDLAKKVAFYAAHALVFSGSVAMAIEPVRDYTFQMLEKFANYFM